MDILPINLDNLIHSRSVESIRIEYKSGWDKYIKASVVRAICAFANDLMNLNGGYIILGIEAPDGVPILPPRGLDPSQLERIQRELRGACKNIDPEYQPLIVPTSYMNQSIIVVWAPAGDNRPYQAPDDRKKREKCYYVRHGAETVKAKGELLRQLVEQTARTPFDDRRNLEANLLDLSPILVKRFLQEVNSDLLNNQPPLSDIDLYKALKIVAEVEEALVPKNVGLLFFNERPDRYFPGAVFDIVQFGDDAGGSLIEERRFEGPIDVTTLEVLEYLDDLTNVQLRKLPDRAKVEHTVAYPYEALEEAVVNATYHRSYENCPEPNKIYLYPDRIEIISYPGPVSGITLEHLSADQVIPPVPARNRRIGEFLKELKLAEMRGTGIPKIRRTMSQNGSPEPTFDFDPDRTYFRVILPAHPRYLVVHTLRESAYLWSIGERDRAIASLKSVFEQQPSSGAIAGQLIEYLYDVGERREADKVFVTFQRTTLKHEAALPHIRYFKLLFGDGERERARQVIESLPEDEYWNDPLEIAVAFRRLKIYDKAHTIYGRVYSANEHNPYYLQNYAKTKIAIANDIRYGRNPTWSTVRRLQKEAMELLRRAISLFEDNVELAWCWFDLARLLSWQRYPRSQIQEAYENAINLLPDEGAFRESYNRWRSRKA